MLKALRIFSQFFVFILLIIFVTAGLCYAQTAPPKIQALVDRLFPKNTPNEADEIRESSIPGIYEIRLRNQVFFIDKKGEFLLNGELIDLQTMQNLTQASLMRFHKEMLEKVAPNSWVQFEPKNVKYVLYVFTDVDCHFCRKFHGHIDELLDLGVEVRYLFAPFRGPDAYARAVGVWCSANPQAAMTIAKKGKDIPLRQCDNPIEKHLEIVREMGIRGTPHIILTNGQVIKGYVEPEKLLKRIEIAGVKPRS